MSLQQFSVAETQKIVSQFQQTYQVVQSGISSRIVGQQDVIEIVLLALFAKGHVLVEGLPGLGKTLMIQTLSEIIDAQYSRIQFTPDLMPADILGTKIFTEMTGEQSIDFEKGPIFANIVLADEINRTTPKTQSALLQAMQEHKITIGNTTHNLPLPFMVFATQNPLEMEGTYPLPEAQLDRFLFKVQIRFPGIQDLIKIAELTTQGELIQIKQKVSKKAITEMQNIVPRVCIAEHILELVAKIIAATHPTSKNAPSLVKRYVKYGASPRGLQALVLGAKARALYLGRAHVSQEDVVWITEPSLCHRIITNFEAEADNINTCEIIRQIVEEVLNVS